MTNIETNGCGAMSGWLSWIKPPHYKFFKNQCTLHDILYTIGGTKLDRKKADKILFDSMIYHSIDYFKDNVISLWWFITLSFLYWISVRIFGGKCFNFKY